jgi:hypothetical protein
MAQGLKGKVRKIPHARGTARCRYLAGACKLVKM